MVLFGRIVPGMQNTLTHQITQKVRLNSILRICSVHLVIHILSVFHKQAKHLCQPVLHLIVSHSQIPIRDTITIPIVIVTIVIIVIIVVHSLRLYIYGRKKKLSIGTRVSPLPTTPLLPWH